MPETLLECYEYLDKLLPEERKKRIKKKDGWVGEHFGLGLLIRNNWIHGNANAKRIFGRINFMIPDGMSYAIIRGYHHYLNGKNVPMEDLGFYDEADVDTEIQLITQNIKSKNEELAVEAYLKIDIIGKYFPEKIEHLVDYAFDDLKNKNSVIREKATSVLGHIGFANADIVKERLHEIMDLYKDENTKIRLSMIHTCIRIAYKKRVDLIVPYINVFEEMLDKVDDPDDREWVAKIFTMIAEHDPELVVRSLEKLKYHLAQCNKNLIRRAVKTIEMGVKNRCDTINHVQNSP